MNTLVYTYRVPGSSEDCCMFWDTVTNEYYCKSCNKVLLIASSNDYCLLATRNDNTDPDRKVIALSLLSSCPSHSSPILSLHLFPLPSCPPLSLSYLVSSSYSMLFLSVILLVFLLILSLFQLVSLNYYY